jgi:hypothetical protein
VLAATQQAACARVIHKFKVMEGVGGTEGEGASYIGLLQHILEHGDMVGKDTAGRTTIQLALADALLDGLLSFGADAADSDEGGDNEPNDVPPVSACWLEMA